MSPLSVGASQQQPVDGGSEWEGSEGEGAVSDA